MLALVAFLVLLGVIVTIHEFGHFIVAKLSNVKVHIFSIGFGQAIFSKVIGETEYRIAWIPLGGYVRLHGMEKEFGEVDSQSQAGIDEDILENSATPELESETISQEDLDQGRSLSDKSPLTKILIFLAGPVMNLILPFLVLPPFYYFSQKYDQEMSSHIGALDEGLPGYQAGLRDGDQVLEINGEKVYAFWQIAKWVKRDQNTDPPLKIKVKRGNQILDFEVKPKEIQETDKFISTKTSHKVIGFQPFALAADLLLNQDSTWSKFGVKSFDRLLEINGHKVERFFEIDPILKQLDLNTPITLVVERLSGIDPKFDFLQNAHRIAVTLPPMAQWDVKIPQLSAQGIKQAGNCIVSLHPNFVASEQLKIGDCIVAVDGMRNQLASFIASRIQHEPEKTKKLTVLRDGKEIEIDFQLKSQTLDNPLAGELTYWPLGFQLLSLARPDSRTDAIMVDNHEERLAFAWWKTVDLVQSEVLRSVMTIGGMFQGNVSPTQLGGPVTIFYLAGENAKAGFDRFLMLMVVLSIGIAILNLMPIPGLDGGHILFATIELLIRKPLPAQVKMTIQSVGVLLLFGLILFALGNDIMRMFRVFSE
jgi:regulator of sigma E protease